MEYHISFPKGFRRDATVFDLLKVPSLYSPNYCETVLTKEYLLQSQTNAMKLHHEALRWITSLTFLLLLLPPPLIAYPYPPWRVKSDGPLLSRFSAHVRADSAWQEYPRPTLVRPPPSFQLLNGLWELDRFSDEAAAPPFKRHLPEQILVPFPVESALSGIRNQSIAGHLWYRRSVRLRANACAGKRVMLRFEACDWNTTVYVNEKVVGSHIGGYDAFAFDVSRVIDCNAENEIIVHVVDTTGSGRHSKEPQQILGKQSHAAFRRLEEFITPALAGSGRQFGSNSSRK